MRATVHKLNELQDSIDTETYSIDYYEYRVPYISEGKLFFIFSGCWCDTEYKFTSWLREYINNHPDTPIGIISHKKYKKYYKDLYDTFIDISDIIDSHETDYFGTVFTLDDKNQIIERCYKNDNAYINFVYVDDEETMYNVNDLKHIEITSAINGTLTTIKTEWSVINEE